MINNEKYNQLTNDRRWEIFRDIERYLEKNEYKIYRKEWVKIFRKELIQNIYKSINTKYI